MSEGGDLSDRVERVDANCKELARRVETLEVLLQDLLLRIASGNGQSVASAPSATSSSTSPALAQAPRLRERYLVVRVHLRLFGLPVDEVREVVRMASLGSIPGADRSLEGLLDLRGEPVPVLSLRRVFGFEPLADDLDCRIVILRLEGRTHGLKADDVLTVEAVDPADVEPPPDLSRSSYVAGVVKPGDEQILLLDPLLLVSALSQSLDLELPPGPDPEAIEVTP